MNELAGAALPSQKFGANAAWLRLNVILYNLLSAYERVGLPAEFTLPDPSGCASCCSTPSQRSSAMPARPCLRCTRQIARALAAPPRTCFALNRPGLAGV
jgi:hypothetical protein